MRNILLVLFFLCTHLSAFSQNREVPSRFPVQGERLFPDLLFTNGSFPEQQEIKFAPKAKSSTTYLDTLYPAKLCTYFHDVIDCDSAYYVSGYTYGNRTSSYYDPDHICLPVRMKLDYSGNVLWSKTDSLMHGDHFVMRNNSIIQLSDGNFLQMSVVENDYTNWKYYDWHAPGYVKFKPNGDTVWTKLYADTTYLKSCDWGQDIIAENDGGFTVTTIQGSDSKSYSLDTIIHYWYVDTTYVGIIRYDSMGNIVRRNQYFIGGEKVYKTIGLLMKQDDGGYIIGGVNNFGGNLKQYFLLKVDSIFNWEWRKLFGQTSDYESYMHLFKNIDNYYYFSVYRSDTPVVVQAGSNWYNGYYHTGIMDSSFNIIKDTIYWMNMVDTLNPYYEFYQDRGVVKGLCYNSNTSGVITVSILGYGANLVCLDSNLNFQWNRWKANFPYFTEEPMKLRQAHDGGYIIVGWTRRGAKGGWFVKTDSLGFALPNGADTLYHIGIGEQPEQNIGFKVYPNPTSEIVNIVFEEMPKGRIQLKLFDITGRLVESKEVNNLKNVSFNLFDLKKGIYILNIKSADGWSKSVKVIKN